MHCAGGATNINNNVINNNVNNVNNINSNNIFDDPSSLPGMYMQQQLLHVQVHSNVAFWVVKLSASM